MGRGLCVCCRFGVTGDDVRRANGWSGNRRFSRCLASAWRESVKASWIALPPRSTITKQHPRCSLRIIVADRTGCWREAIHNACGDKSRRRRPAPDAV